MGATSTQLGPVQIVAIIAGTVTVLGFARVLINGIFEWWRNTWGSRWMLAGKLDRLELGLSGQIVTEILGTPTIVQSAGLEPDNNFKVRRYLLRYAWVSVLVDGADAARAISVSSLDSRLRFNLDKWSLGMLKGRLGLVRFAETGINDDYPEALSAGIGANRSGYSETFYFGNPALYRSFRLSSNDAFPRGEEWTEGVPEGFAGGSSWQWDRSSEVFEDSDLPDLPTLQHVRSYAVVNTFTVYKLGESFASRVGAVTEADWSQVAMMQPELPPAVELYRRMRAVLGRRKLRVATFFDRRSHHGS